MPVRKEGVEEALISSIKAARRLSMLEEAFISILGWCIHKHARVETIWPTNVTRCCQLRVGEEVIRVLYTLKQENR